MRIQIDGGGSAEINEPNRGQFTDNLSGAVQYALAHTLYKVLEVMGAGLGTFAGGFLVNTLDLLAPHMVHRLEPIVNELLSWPELPPFLRDYIGRIRGGTGEVDPTLLLGLGGGIISAGTGSIFNVAFARTTQNMQKRLRPTLAGPGEALAMEWRGTPGGAWPTDWMERAGLPPELILGLREIYRPRLGIADELAASYRLQLNPDAAIAELDKRGYTRIDKEKILEISHVLPGIPDLIHMMVREAFRPDVIHKWGYDQDYPGEMDRYASQQGLSPEWAKRYWYAHWELPSINLGVEMVHRGIITTGEFDELLRIADYPAGWRSRIARSIYAPYTRVDTRRMYAVGVLNRDEVKRTYLDLGYDDEHAENLTLWTEHEYGDEEREVTKADALAAYGDSIITREVCDGFLKDLGYPVAYRNLLLARADYKKNKALLDLQVAAIRAQYLAGTMDRGTAITALNRLTLSSGQVDALMEKWDTERITKLRIPAAGQLSDMLFHEVLTAAVYQSYMLELGYKQSAINDFYRLTLHLKQEAAAKEFERLAKEAERAAEKAKLEEERRRKEAERIAKLARTDKEKAWNAQQAFERSLVMFDREQVGALLRKQVAQLKLESYDLELSLTAESTEDEIAAVYTTIDTNTRQLKVLAVELAGLNLQYQYVPRLKPVF